MLLYLKLRSLMINNQPKNTDYKHHRSWVLQQFRYRIRKRYRHTVCYVWLILTMNSKCMDCRKVIKTLKHKDFIKIPNNGEWFEEGAAIYAKEITENIFLVFIILKDINIENIKALIAHFDCFNSIGLKEPEQIMFYLSIKDKEDLHYFEQYLKASSN